MKLLKYLKKFSNNKSSGSNSLPTPILKNCDVLSFPILYLVNLSFTTRQLPKPCKIAKVILLFKKGDPLIVQIMDHGLLQVISAT